MHPGSRIVACAIGLTAAFSAAAGDVYKCVTPDGTSYQSMPCARRDTETRMTFARPVATPRAEAQPIAAASAQLRDPHVGRPGPWRHRTLTLGMSSDDEVLNLPGWGRPARIARTRMPRAWHEMWIYGNGVAGERQLHFINARLSDVVDAPSAQVAVTLQ